MSHQHSTIPGFEDRPALGKQRKRVIRFVTLFYLIPAAVLLVLDATNQPAWQRMILVLTPFIILRRQVRLWFHHLRRFGMPPLSHLRRMLKLEAMRGYDLWSHKIEAGNHRRFSPRIVVALIVCLLGGIAWRATGYAILLFPASMTATNLVIASIRGSRPPAVLVLGASRTDSSRLQLLEAHHGPLSSVVPSDSDPDVPAPSWLDTFLVRRP